MHCSARVLNWHLASKRLSIDIGIERNADELKRAKELCAMATLTCTGISESAGFNALMVAIKVGKSRRKWRRQ